LEINYALNQTQFIFLGFFPYDSLQGYRPLGFDWLLIATIPHFFGTDTKLNRKNWFAFSWIFGLHAIAGWIVAALILRTLSSPLWSYWCLTSMVYLISPYFIWYFIAPFLPESFFEKDEVEVVQPIKTVEHQETKTKKKLK